MNYLPGKKEPDGLHGETFRKDLFYSQKMRGKLKPFYEWKSFEGRFIFINKESAEISSILQKRLAVDTILALSDYKEIYIEEKIVRWPGYKYTAFVLEVQSCSVAGKESPGWMEYGLADYLAYGFEQEDGQIELYLIPFKKLKNWFWKNCISYSETKTTQLNQTVCKIVPIKDVKMNVGFEKFFIPKK